MNSVRLIGISTRLVSVIGLFCALACSGGASERGGQQESNVNGACSAESDDGPEDKVVCSVDTDCDSDEVCLNGKCTGLDGDVEDEEGCDAEDADDTDAADEAEEADDTEEEEAGADKIYCSTDADCDSDEVCVNGKCD